MSIPRDVTLDVWTDAEGKPVGVFKNPDGSLYEPNASPAPTQKLDSRADSWARFNQARAENASAAADEEGESDPYAEAFKQIDADAARARAEYMAKLREAGLEDDEDGDEGESTTADAGPIVLTGEAVEQIEAQFYQSDEFDVPYEKRQEIAAWARSALAGGGNVTEEMAVEHLTEFFGLDEATASRLIDLYFDWANAWNDGQRTTSSSKSMSRDAALAAIERIRKDPNHLYHAKHALHPGRQAALDEIAAPYRIAYPG